VGCEAFFIKKSFFVINFFLSFVSFLLFFFHSQRREGGHGCRVNKYNLCLFD
jgi:hypothetical protein